MNSWLETQTGLYLQHPAWLWLLVLLPLAWLLRRTRPAPSAAMTILRPPGTPPSKGARWPRSWRQRLQFLPGSIEILSLVLLAFALARPVVREPRPLVSAGVDMLLCLDTSSSMAEKDMDPQRSRLELAREAALRFLEGRPQDRIGLITFARDPELACPPTLDHAALRRLLEEVQLVEKDSEEDQTGIGAAVARAAELLRDAPSKVVILWTDGEENVATADSPDEVGPYQAAWLCEQLGVRVYVVTAGLGRPGPGGRFVPLDTTQVEELARRSSGAVFAAKDAAAAARIYRRIDQLERIEFEEQRYTLRDCYPYFAWVALLLWGLRIVLRRRVLEVLP